MGAFSGLEMACWDILGKAHERPVYALLGGLMNERIRSYSYLYPLERHDIKTFWNELGNGSRKCPAYARAGLHRDEI